MSASADGTIDLDVLRGRNDIAVVFHFTFLSIALELVFDGGHISFAGALSLRGLHCKLGLVFCALKHRVTPNDVRDLLVVGALSEG
jgi:hypothetical protein